MPATVSMTTKAKRGPTFRKRYVLAEGYPWGMGKKRPREHDFTYTEVAISASTMGLTAIPLEWPVELWSAEVPRYRLVLVRVETKKARRP